MKTQTENCPGCGKRGWVAHYEAKFAVYCGNADCDYDGCSGDSDTRDGAIERWNRLVTGNAIMWGPRPTSEPQQHVATLF